MSGGPVFDSNTGRVCGVVCSGGPPGDDGSDFLSYASTLWPIVGTQVDLTESHYAGGEYLPMIKLFEMGMCKARDLERVRVVRTKEGLLRPQAAYDRQEWDKRSDR